VKLAALTIALACAALTFAACGEDEEPDRFLPDLGEATGAASTDAATRQARKRFNDVCIARCAG